MANVRDYGAVGDGIADDTEAIRHAVAEGDGTLRFDRGTYRLRGTVEVVLGDRGPLAIVGDGTARVVMEAAGPAFKIVGTHEGTAEPASQTPRVAAKERLPTVSGIEIHGAHADAVGVELSGTVQATLQGVLIRRCLIGVHLTKRNRNLLIDACHLYEGQGPAIGVYFDGVDLHQAIIVGCHISYHRHAGIKIARSEIRNLQITGNDIEYNDADREGEPDSADVWIDAREGRVREGTIASNTIQAKPSPGGANIRIEGPDRDDAAGAGLWTIVGNVLQDQERNLWLRACRGVNVVGNSFASAVRHSIDIDACRVVAVGPNTIDRNPDYQGDPPIYRNGVVVRRSSSVTLTGLILETVRAGRPDRGAAISVLDSDAVTIGHCQIIDPTARGIEVADSRNVLIDACTVIDRRSPPAMTEAIRVRGRSAAVALRGNLLTGGEETIAIDDPDAATISGTIAAVGRGG